MSFKERPLILSKATAGDAFSRTTIERTNLSKYFEDNLSPHATHMGTLKPKPSPLPLPGEAANDACIKTLDNTFT